VKTPRYPGFFPILVGRHAFATISSARWISRALVAIAIFAFPAWSAAGTLGSIPAVLHPGEDVVLRWGELPADIEEMELLLSLDDGRTFNLHVSAELDPHEPRFRWRVPNVAAEHARLAIRVGRTSLEGREELLAPSNAFRIVFRTDQPIDHFALREGGAWVDDVTANADPVHGDLAAPAATLAPAEATFLCATFPRNTPEVLRVLENHASIGAELREFPCRASQHASPTPRAPLRN